MNSYRCVSTSRHHRHLPLGGLQPSGASRIGSVRHHLSPLSFVQFRPLSATTSIGSKWIISTFITQKQQRLLYKNGKMVTKKKKKSTWLSVPQVSFLSCSSRTRSAQTVEEKDVYDPIRPRSVCLEKLLLFSFLLFSSRKTKLTQARQPRSE